jgi:hypothetical protein
MENIECSTRSKRNFEEPCAVMSASTDLWEPWQSNLRGHPIAARSPQKGVKSCKSQHVKTFHEYLAGRACPVRLTNRRKRVLRGD